MRLLFSLSHICGKQLVSCKRHTLFYNFIFFKEFYLFVYSESFFKLIGMNVALLPWYIRWSSFVSLRKIYLNILMCHVHRQLCFLFFVSVEWSCACTFLKGDSILDGSRGILQTISSLFANMSITDFMFILFLESEDVYK